MSVLRGFVTFVSEFFVELVKYSLLIFTISLNKKSLITLNKIDSFDIFQIFMSKFYLIILNATKEHLLQQTYQYVRQLFS